jgi:hypothetical protein
MPVYMLYGFRWPRAGFTGIRVYIVLHNLEDATAEYVQKPITNKLLIDSFSKTDPGIVANLPELRFIEQYDPEDESDDAVSKPYAYVGAKVISIPEEGAATAGTSWNTDIFQENPLDAAGDKALTEFRDKYAAGERIGWWIVYNGDPERYYPHEEGEEYDDDIMEEDEDYDDNYDYDRDRNSHSNSSEAPSTPTVCSHPVKTSLTMSAWLTPSVAFSDTASRVIYTVFYQEVFVMVVRVILRVMRSQTKGLGFVNALDFGVCGSLRLGIFSDYVGRIFCIFVISFSFS